MDFALSFDSDSLERIAWTLAEQEKAVQRGSGSTNQRSRPSDLVSSTSGEAKPKIVHLVEGCSVTVADNLAKLVMSRLAHKYHFACVCLGSPSSKLEELRRGGLSVHIVERRPGLDWRCTRRLASLLQREKADLVHAHQSAAFFYGLFARLQYVKPPILFTEHDRPHPDFPSPRRASINRILVESRDRVVAASRSVRQALILNEGLPPEQVEVVYNGIATPKPPDLGDIEAARSRLGLEAGAFLILQSAPFDLSHNHALAIQAMEQVVRDIPEARLVLAGDGPEMATIQTMVSRSDLESYVKLIGAPPDGDALLQAADVVLSTSLGDADPSVLFQALALGCPVVATRVGSVAEIVEDRVCGLLVNPGDYGALAEMIVRLRSNPELRQQFGVHGRRRALRMFSEEETSLCYASIYQSMLSR